MSNDSKRPHPMKRLSFKQEAKILKRLMGMMIKQYPWQLPLAGLVIILSSLAGIVGNVIDRLFRGFVIDMFDFHWGVHHFPCFNIADSCICVAVGLLLLMSLRSETK